MKSNSLSLLLFGEGYETPADFVDLVVKAEELDFKRVWLGEHYTFNSLWCNPEPLLPIALSYTSKINIGCAGLLMPLHSPYRVANSFKVLSTFFPERLDLGYAAGHTGHGHLNDFLTNTPKVFSEQITQTHQFLQNDSSFLKDNIPVSPFMGNLPNEWLLTGGYNSLDLALSLQLNISRSIFHRGVNQSFQKNILHDFRHKFYDMHGFEPQITLAFAGVCHYDKKDAERVYQSSILSKNDFVVPNLIGTPSEFMELMYEYDVNYGINDFVFMNLAEKTSDKVIGMELLSNVFELT